MVVTQAPPERPNEPSLVTDRAEADLAHHPIGWQVAGLGAYARAGVDGMDLSVARGQGGSVREALVRMGYDRDLLPADPVAEVSRSRDTRFLEGIDPEARESFVAQRERDFAKHFTNLPDDFDEPVQRPQRPPAPAGATESRNPVSRATRAAFMAARNLGPQRKDRPSQTPEGRRERYLRGLVAQGRYSSVEEADRLTRHNERYDT